MKNLMLIFMAAIALFPTIVHAAELRLFLAPVGLSNPADPNSPLAGFPTQSVPVLAPTLANKRLYLWAKPTGSPANQVWNGITLNVYCTAGSGSTQITAWQIFNYNNGAGYTRWSSVAQGSHSQPGVITGITMLKILNEQGVQSSPPAADQHYDSVSHATLLGWFEFQGSGAVYLEVGSKGIARKGGPPPPGELVYLGWGDDADGLTGASYNTRSSAPEALFTNAVGTSNSLWTSPTGLTYQGGTNWSPIGVPGASGTAHFVGLPDALTLNANITSDKFIVHQNTLLDFDLNGRTLNCNRLELNEDGFHSPAIMLLNDGSLQVNDVLIVGNGPHVGQLGVSSGATLHIAATATQLKIGNESGGVGDLYAVSGGHIVIDGPVGGAAIIASEDLSNGLLRLRGIGSTLTSAVPLHIGDSPLAGCSGTLHIDQGATAVVPSCIVAYGSTLELTLAFVTIDGTGSSLTITDQLTVGQHGIATLRITDGGSLTSDRTAVGMGNGGANAYLEDPGSTWHATGDMYLSGYDVTLGGPSFLRVADGATLTTDVKFGTFPKGEIELDGGTITMNSDGGSAGTIHAIRGQMTSTGVGDDFELFPPGVFYPGDPGSRLLIDIAGPMPVVNYPFIAIGGDFTAAGSITVTLTGGYVLSPGQEIVLIAASNVGGTFAPASLPSGTTLRYDPNAVMLVGPACPAPVVPTFTVSTYASVIDPVQLSFAPSGAMYVGRDAGGSGGTSTQPVKIHRVGAGGSPVVDYGLTVLNDPDAVAVDVNGAFAAAGSVLVGGQSTVANQGYLAAISSADQSITMLLGGPNPIYADPHDMVFDHTGRLLIADKANKTVLAWTPGQPAPVVLISLGGPQSRRIRSIAVDASNRIYTSTEEGIIRRHNADGTSGIVLATGLSIPAPLAIGPGGMWGKKVYAISAGKLLRFDTNTPGAGEQVGCGFANTTIDIAFGPDGALYVSCFGDDQIVRIGRLSGDVTGNGTVNVDDLLVIINGWGRCPPAPADCPADVAPPPHGNGVVNVDDLLAVINGWG